MSGAPFYCVIMRIVDSDDVSHIFQREISRENGCSCRRRRRGGLPYSFLHFSIILLLISNDFTQWRK
jgi:hypothetical protein